MNLGYDQAVALPAMQADGKSGQEDIFKETNKVFDVGRGAIEMEVNKAWITFKSVFTMSFLFGCSQSLCCRNIRN